MNVFKFILTTFVLFCFVAEASEGLSVSSLLNEKEQVTDLNSNLQPAQPSISEYSVYSKKTGQDFSATVLQMLLSKEFDDVEITQKLGGTFDRAYEARQRLNYCHKFINADGEFGPWGEVISLSLDKFEELDTQLMSDQAAYKAGMKLVCPRFQSLTVPERKEFWVWTLATLALFESTCGFNTVNPINPNAVGIFQLHASTSDRSPRSLINNKVCGKINSVEIAKPENNLVCTLDFIRDGFSGRTSHAPAGLITRAQQFERLRSETNGIIKVIQSFKLCQITTKDRT